MEAEINCTFNNNRLKKRCYLTSCLNENGFNLWCNAHLKYKLWCAALNTSIVHIQTQKSQLFWGAVPCSITPTCSLGPRIKWPLSHWSANLTTWATASYNWCCDEATTFIMITSESANAEKIWTHKSQDMWAAKCAANHEFGPISMYKMEGLYS